MDDDWKQQCDEWEVWKEEIKRLDDERAD